MPKKATKKASITTATPDVYERADGAKWAKSQLWQQRVGNRFVLRTRAGGEYVDSSETRIPGVDGA
jgi:hypothetical protein